MGRGRRVRVLPHVGGIRRGHQEFGGEAGFFGLGGGGGGSCGDSGEGFSGLVCECVGDGFGAGGAEAFD